MPEDNRVIITKVLKEKFCDLMKCSSMSEEFQRHFEIVKKSPKKKNKQDSQKRLPNYCLSDNQM
jgi:hypothetical protein